MMRESSNMIEFLSIVPACGGRIARCVHCALRLPWRTSALAEVPCSWMPRHRRTAVVVVDRKAYLAAIAAIAHELPRGIPIARNG